ncbi:50S ribosome-binding GTPase [Shewanella sp. SM72]|uniref:GTPase family protein n=1 Tax=Shewanella sp. SM72 TaxID=2912805 RepID=UPI0021D935DC|nr:dynamin family protein [Shewanella sp. SM72]MCU8015958.1 50S ribosome-binding GTPase [Shewanella sp. SM72]
MSNITTKILFEDDIENLDEKFHFLKDVTPVSSIFSDWHYTIIHRLGYEKRKAINVIFIGQTGYGKSSLINKIVKKDVFETSDYQSCTKVLQSADYFLGHNKGSEKQSSVLSFVDLPGIGENDKADKNYLQWYQEYIKKAAVIVYLFRADKRDHTHDEFFFNNVFDKRMSERLICVVTQADKIEPLSRSDELSNEQKHNLEIKKSEIKNKSFLDFNSLTLVHVSSYLNININEFENEITKKLNSMREGLISC